MEEKLLKAKKGGLALALILGFFLMSMACIVLSIIYLSQAASVVPVPGLGGMVGYRVNTLPRTIAVVLIILSGLYIFIIGPFLSLGLKVINPNEALVLVLFGKYCGTLKTEGFYWVNPFCVAVNPTARSITNFTPVQMGGAVMSGTTVSSFNGSKKVSLKAMTLNNDRQKVNDQEGNPIEICVVVIWRIVNASKAVFNVENYNTFISTQCDSTIRHVARLYPYDVSQDGDEKSLRGSSQEIAYVLKSELQRRVDIAGIEVLEARISHLAYAPEIAAAMLQRQQAAAIIAARAKIVEGAVGMVEMALNKLSENKIVDLDDERKAAMVSNLLVVLCANKEAQPIVNSGSIY